MPFKLDSVYQLSKPEATCDNCGHDIAQLFHIHEVDTGRKMTVGSECVSFLLAGQDFASAELMKRRMNRAAAQWRKQQPMPNSGETRTDYINRRVAEMGNALKAHHVWTAEYATLFQARGTFGGWSTTYDMKVQARGKRLGIYIERADIKWRHLHRIARKLNANPFDFTRPTWDVRKI